MQNLTLTSNILTEQNMQEQLTFFPEDFPAKTFQFQTNQKKRMVRKASKANGQDFGKNMRVWFGKLDLELLCLKTAQCSLIEDSSTSYATFPSSGIMLNGDCFMLPSSDFRTYEKGFLELPTPSASDGKILLKTAASYKKYYRNKHQDKALYQFHLNGLTANQAMKMYEWMMGFPKNWIKKLYTDSEML